MHIDSFLEFFISKLPGEIRTTGILVTFTETSPIENYFRVLSNTRLSTVNISLTASQSPVATEWRRQHPEAAHLLPV